MHSSIPIIALTADVTTMDLEKCKDVGMNDYLAKPVDEKLLFNKIISLVRSQNVVNEVKSNLNDNEAGEYINYIDLTYLSQKTKSNPLLMMEMISLYLEQTPPLILSMKKALLEKNWNLLYSAVHKMIPSFSIIGLNSDFEIMAKKIQDYASTKKQTEEIHEMVLKLEEVCNHACIQLTKEFTKLKNSNK